MIFAVETVSKLVSVDFSLETSAGFYETGNCACGFFATPCVRIQSGFPHPVTYPSTSNKSFAANVSPFSAPLVVPSIFGRRSA